MVTTKAAVIESAGAPFTLREVELEDPRPNEVLVRIDAASLCHTDLAVAAGYIPFPLPGVLGHEGAGVVERVGSAVTHVRTGDRVVLSYTSCGHCTACVSAHPAYCLTWQRDNLIGGSRTDGSSAVRMDGKPIGSHFFGQSCFARHAVVDARSAVKVDEDVPVELLAPLGCSVQTGTGAIWNTLRPEFGSTVVVLGLGAVGLSAVMAATLSPAGSVIAVGRKRSQLELATKLGATHTINSAEEDLGAALRELTGGEGVNYAVEATGSTKVLRTAVDSLAVRGAVAVIGAPPMGDEVSLDVHVLMSGRQVVGVVEGDTDPHRYLPVLARLVGEGRQPVSTLIREYPFSDIDKAVRDVQAREVIKPVLRLDA
jgi:aryl-alcohol dehydrogenase